MSPFSERVRDARLAMKRTHGRRYGTRATAERLGVSHPYLAKVESGDAPPSDRVIRGLAEELGEDPDELYALAGVIPHDVRDAFRENAKLFKLVRTARDASPDRIDRAVRRVREGEW